MDEKLEKCARQLMETIPTIMQTIRVEMRSGRGSDLSIPQFRALRFIQSNDHPTLSAVADVLGLTLPSTSKIVDGLVKKKLISRSESIKDRRCLALEINPSGEAIVNAAQLRAQTSLVNILKNIPQDQSDLIYQCMSYLQSLFDQNKR